MELLRSLENSQVRSDLPEFRVGDTIAVHVKIKEGDKERVQVFEGVVIRRHRGGQSATVTVRKVSYGVGVERIFALNGPTIEKISVVTRGHVRKARLYYLRALRGKAARIRAKKVAYTKK